MSVGSQRPVALITGASGGIGKELAHEIARDGFDVVLVARDEAALNSVGQELGRQYEVDWLVIPLDLSQISQVNVLCKTLQKRSIEPELIVNNAGFGVTGAAIEGDVEEQLGSVVLNVSVLTELTLGFLPDLVAKNRGGILNVGSVVGFLPGPYFATYYATKAYVRSFTMSIAYELRDTDVSICLMCPGATSTGFHKRAGVVQASGADARGFMSAKEVAKIGYAGYKRGRTVVVTGFLNKFIVAVSRIVPQSLFARAVARFNKGR